MNTQKNNGGPAFPRAGFLSGIETPEQLIAQYENMPQQGMNLRDYFAGKALSGLLAHEKSSSWEAYEVAGDCYGYADAMIKARGASK
jgi:hypothetical protein